MEKRLFFRLSVDSFSWHLQHESYSTDYTDALILQKEDCSGNGPRQDKPTKTEFQSNISYFQRNLLLFKNKVRVLKLARGTSYILVLQITDKVQNNRQEYKKENERTILRFKNSF